jgi:hypothetical protein
MPVAPRVRVACLQFIGLDLLVTILVATGDGGGDVLSRRCLALLGLRSGKSLSGLGFEG